MVAVIGDIHGCFHTLKKLYALILKKYPDIPVCAVGDLVDRGKYSYEVVEFIRKVTPDLPNYPPLKPVYRSCEAAR